MGYSDCIAFGGAGPLVEQVLGSQGFQKGMDKVHGKYPDTTRAAAALDKVPAGESRRPERAARRERALAAKRARRDSPEAGDRHARLSQESRELERALRDKQSRKNKPDSRAGRPAAGRVVGAEPAARAAAAPRDYPQGPVEIVRPSKAPASLMSAIYQFGFSLVSGSAK